MIHRRINKSIFRRYIHMSFFWADHIKADVCARRCFEFSCLANCFNYSLCKSSTPALFYTSNCQDLRGTLMKTRITVSMYRQTAQQIRLKPVLPLQWTLPPQPLSLDSSAPSWDKTTWDKFNHSPNILGYCRPFSPLYVFLIFLI